MAMNKSTLLRPIFVSHINSIRAPLDVGLDVENPFDSSRSSWKNLMTPNTNISRDHHDIDGSEGTCTPVPAQSSPRLSSNDKVPTEADVEAALHLLDDLHNLRDMQDKTCLGDAGVGAILQAEQDSRDVFNAYQEL
ncbi:hypothetical protein OPT61_g9087 [Boeremia exigua]|uniref:Uncharacterized protein n=1 Tax=Boeremia exigua TaxID=749465 RepID=A0ACC2HW52_9PLEO|nr:hypothetical protein OPT61_g9087 [Boeremia exigua]